jgi:putative ABC transport system permease protein
MRGGVKVFSIKLGFKNLTRQKRRNIITALVIAFAFFTYLFMYSLMNGMEEMSFENIKNLETGNIQITYPEYWEKREELPLENLIYLDQDVEESLENIDGLSGISPELRFSANLNNGIDELPVMGLGIDPEHYKEVFTTGEYLVDGSMLSLDEYKAVIGEKLAQLMDLKINDYITLLVRTKDDTFNTIDVEIAGLLHTPHPMVNAGTVFVPLDIAQRALNVGKKAGIGVILSVVLLIGIVGIINNVILSALERIEEIGMMKALGMREMEIVLVFMVEATGIGIIGGLAGCLFGAVGVGWLVKYGFDIGYLGDTTQYGIPILDKIYGIWNLSSFGFLFILGVAVALLSSIAPALWAAHKDPVKAIYHR